MMKTVLYEINTGFKKYLVNKDMTRIYKYDNWKDSDFCRLHPTVSGCQGSYAGDNILIGYTPNGKEIFSQGYWYEHWEGLMDEKHIKIIKEKLNNLQQEAQ